MLALALTVYSAVLVAELVGDKLLYTVAALTGRYDLSSVGVGLALACAGKMLGAVAFGHVISRLPVRVVSGVTAATFVITAVAIWRRRPDAGAATAEAERKAPRVRSGVLVTFASIFFTEWGDLGQLTAASMTARSGAPAVVWAASTAALLTKGVLAVTIGLGLRRFLPLNLMRYTAVAMCLTMAVIAIGRLEP
jgi:putative Ca2+/H+ antiporter (TMEM165/GDT1 family)